MSVYIRSSSGREAQLASNMGLAEIRKAARPASAIADLLSQGWYEPVRSLQEELDGGVAGSADAQHTLAQLSAWLAAEDGDAAVALHSGVEEDDLAKPRATKLAAAHAPKGGIVIGGQRFEGGEFIPGEVMAKATAEEKRRLDGSESAAPRSRSNSLDRISFKDGLTINGNVYAKGDVIPFDEWYAAKTKAMNGTPDKKLIEVLDKMKKVGQPTRQRFTGQERAGAGNVRWINLDEVRFPQPLSEEVSPLKSNKDKPIIVTKTEDGFKLLDGFGRASGMKNYGNERVFAIVVTKGDIAENEGSSDDPVWGRRMYKRYAPSISYSESEN